MVTRHRDSAPHAPDSPRSPRNAQPIANSEVVADSRQQALEGMLGLIEQGKARRRDPNTGASRYQRRSSPS